MSLTEGTEGSQTSICGSPSTGFEPETTRLAAGSSTRLSTDGSPRPDGGSLREVSALGARLLTPTGGPRAQSELIPLRMGMKRVRENEDAGQLSSLKLGGDDFLFHTSSDSLFLTVDIEG